ncbi:MFS transporter [Sphingomonas morindae]|uniref:MFS transporter n=2 Tax=Sphingomonas morindae TaxID=1541170 RepID=A0ABY4XCE0_9SPHN|nr:MFS transporter [Sphingomonas morindae]USI74494.1 MFS transporter [Sphingomonas morindae]
MPAAFLMQFDKHMMPIFAPQIRKDFSLSLVEVAHVLAAVTWTYALFQIPGAWMARRLSPIRTIGVCVVGWSFAVLLTPFALGAIGLLFMRALMGAFQAPDFVSSMMLLQREVPLRLRSRGSASLLAAAYLGAITSGPIAAEVAQLWGWRDCFRALGAFGMVFGALVYAYATFDQKRRRSICAVEMRRDGGLFRTISRRDVRSLAISYMLFLALQSFIFAMFPLYLSEVWRTDLVRIGWLSSIPLAALYLAVVFGGVISDMVLKRSGSLFISRVWVGGAAMVCSGLWFAIGMSAGTLIAMVTLMCVGMGFVGLGQVALWSTVQDFSEGSSGFVAASVQLLGGLGAGLGPVVMAHIVSYAGDWGHVRLFLSALSVGAGTFLVLAHRHGRLARQEGAAVAHAKWSGDKGIETR